MGASGRRCENVLTIEILAKTRAQRRRQVETARRNATSDLPSSAKPLANSNMWVTKNMRARSSSKVATICRAISVPSRSLVAAKDSLNEESLKLLPELQVLGSAAF